MNGLNTYSINYQGVKRKNKDFKKDYNYSSSYNSSESFIYFSFLADWSWRKQ
jgi:hypothetical protein